MQSQKKHDITHWFQFDASTLPYFEYFQNHLDEICDVLEGY